MTELQQLLREASPQAVGLFKKYITALHTEICSHFEDLLKEEVDKAQGRAQQCSEILRDLSSNAGTVREHYRAGYK